MAKRARLTGKQIEALRRVDSATISNAIETFNVRDRTAGYATLGAGPYPTARRGPAPWPWRR